MRKKHKESRMQMKQEYKAEKNIQEDMSKKIWGHDYKLENLCKNNLASGRWKTDCIFIEWLVN